ncbi:hypothetical protein BKA66DRAFT_507664 [Pyrenochaeta sp. MPI-SDFR-AT-0127]|nr:hypothetical protein BKA66DRAFT_507664 [Pyrenochaeta sp. MPI-SDFR-AT-0127]
MRPFRLLLSLSTSLIALTLFLYLVLASPQDEEFETAPASANKGNVKALFSFTSPGSLFPPSAIISLTDDNSTFFLARPAAFGPALPKDGLSGPLWIGKGFGDDTWSKGELGCGDVPEQGDGEEGVLDTTTSATHAKSGTKNTVPAKPGAQQGRLVEGDDADISKGTTPDDGTDDHLYPGTQKTYRTSNTRHADIQSLQESAEIAGKVALLKRGGCGFLAKVQWAQTRGASAVIVGDDVRGGALIRMYAKGDTSNITIPSLFTSHTTAHLLSSLLPSDDSRPEPVADKLFTSEGSKDRDEVNFPDPDKKQDHKSWPASSEGAPELIHEKQQSSAFAQENPQLAKEQKGWLDGFLSIIGFGGDADNSIKAGSRRLPTSGDLEWVEIGDWDDDRKPLKTKPASPSHTSTVVTDGFNIGEQDWRDPDLLPFKSSTSKMRNAATSTPAIVKKSENALPESGVYTRVARKYAGHRRWWSKWPSSSADTSSKANAQHAKARGVTSITGTDFRNVETSPIEPVSHQGLWVTLTPTNVSTSPFFDTLLVLVVSPLVTLTVVYALLLLRSRIRRRRWRAPKSVVERLPVRTYQTISGSSLPPTPDASSPTTPLLQHSPSQLGSTDSHSRTSAESEAPATSSSIQHGARDREEDKHESGLAAWRRRYGGRQRECVVCLEEYEDGVSQVMSLPCGHEFHADCITPWLVTRRRTCPICKGDVVRSLSQSYHDRLQSPSPTRSPRYLDDADDVQTQAAETRNDSPSASRPVPISMSGPAAYTSHDDDVEAGRRGDERRQNSRDNPESRSTELSSSLRELSSTVSTVIWRGFEAVRNTTGLQRRSPPDDVDRDR